MFLGNGLIRFVLFGALAASASAESITVFTDTVGASSPTQLGRPARYGSAQDWANDEAYPGLAPGSATSTYHYKTYDFAAGLFTGAPFLEVTAFDLYQESNVFVSAYRGSYDPVHPATNWLGDSGSSNFSFNVAAAFEVLLPTNSDLVLVVNTADPGNINGGVTNPYTITVDAYADSDFSEPIITPEPSTLLLLSTGMLGFASTGMLGPATRMWRRYSGRSTSGF